MSSSCETIQIISTYFIENEGYISCNFVEFSIVNFGGGANFTEIKNLTMVIVTQSNKNVFSNNAIILIKDSIQIHSRMRNYGVWCGQDKVGLCL